jgi:hypothetical protein
MYLRSFSASMRLHVVAIMAAFVLLLGTAQQPSAQQPTGLTVSAFLANPSLILQQNPRGGPQMISELRDFAVSDEATLTAILGLIPNANKEQKAAIGAALAQAARIVVRTNQAYSQRIQYLIAETKDEDVILAYAAVAGDRPIGAVGGGAGGGGGAVGGQTNPLAGPPSGTGPAQVFGSGGAGTQPFSFTSSVSGTGGTNSSTSVSP